MIAAFEGPGRTPLQPPSGRRAASRHGRAGGPSRHARARPPTPCGRRTRPWSRRAAARGWRRCGRPPPSSCAPRRLHGIAPRIRARRRLRPPASRHAPGRQTRRPSLRRSPAGASASLRVNSSTVRRSPSIWSACRCRVCSSSAMRCCAAPTSRSSVSRSGLADSLAASAISAIRRRVSSSHPSSVTRTDVPMSNSGRNTAGKSAAFGTSAPSTSVGTSVSSLLASALTSS